ncbi:MAG TPA: oxygenase MpaB family protein [Bryobacteraceae bacterium]|nr:oxygenase MpaB family protein [Bryobacteraceae bacterium]
MATVTPPSLLWSDSLLDPMRQRGDPLADAVVSELFAGGDIAAVNGLMKNLIVNEFPVPENLPAIVRDYLTKTDSLPDWADPALIKAGEQVFWRFGPQLVVILNTYALPYCYVGKNGVQVLALTTRLLTNPTRRILETAQLLVDVMQPGGLTTAQGRGRRDIQKVRLMHAAVRKLAPMAPGWAAQYGLPVNQEDLAGTLMAFSWISLNGLKKLGIAVPETDQEAYLHCWRIVGYLLGIREEMLPKDMTSAEALSMSIARRQFGPCPEGQEMTKALVGMLGNVVPGDLFRHVPPMLIRYFLGEQWAGWLGIAESPWTEMAVAPLRLLGMQASDILNDSKAARALAEKFGHLLIGAIVYIDRGGNRPSFTIPAELRQQWGVNWTS